MHPRLRFWLIVAAGVTTGVVASFGLAEETYLLAALVAALVAWLALEWLGGPRPEAWVLAATLVGYLLGNRGFAQLQLLSQFPLLPAETALLVGIAAALLRMALRQTSAIARDPLNTAILVWVLLGAARLWPDFRTHGFVALRDFAVVYYALFFFFAQSLVTHAASYRLLRHAMIGAVAALPAVYFIFLRFTDFFLHTLQFRGAPIFFYKDDLVAANLFAGFFLLMTVPAWPALLRGGLALAAYGLAFSIQSSRAAIVGLLVASAWWAVARRWAPWKLQALAAPCALAALASLAILSDRPFQQSRLYTLYEHTASMVDFTGTGRYTTDDRRYVGDNNRFRLAWWRSVAEETYENSPVFGLGFGADLTSRFLRTYELDLGDEFTTRSPHSIIFTVLGRTGLIGLIAFLAVLAAMAVRTVQLARLARIDDRALPSLGWWSVSWVTLTSACFGVVLEGPMGAVIFWTALGLANTRSDDADSATPTSAPGDALSSPVSPAPEPADLRPATPEPALTSRSAP